MSVILEAKDIVKEFKLKKERLFDTQRTFRAVDTISLELKQGETVGIVGESGSGKSTLSEIIGDLQQPSSGTIRYEGQDVRTFSKEQYKAFRQNVQFIFQSPKDSLHPFYTIKENLLEPLRVNNEAYNRDKAMQEIEQMIKKVKLEPEILKKYASEISGGQAQRVAIARALLLKPKVIICDECVSALDVSVQAQILDLLVDLQQEFGTSYLFISHDISAVNYVSDYLVVMQNGKVVEEGEAEEVLFHPKNEYTKTLISSSFITEEDEVYAM
jgi:ABC-type oligopeptide transport system ATPase subunit